MDIILETAKNWLIVGTIITIIGFGLNWISGWFEGVSDARLMMKTYSEEELQKVYDDCERESKRHHFRDWLKSGVSKGWFVLAIIVWPKTIFIVGWSIYSSMKKIVLNLRELHRLRR